MKPLGRVKAVEGAWPRQQSQQHLDRRWRHQGWLTGSVIGIVPKTGVFAEYFLILALILLRKE